VGGNLEKKRPGGGGWGGVAGVCFFGVDLVVGRVC